MTLSFNGIYRVNSKGKFNVPYGDNPKKVFDYERIRNVSKLHTKHAKFMRDACVGLYRKVDGDIVAEIQHKDLGLNVGLPLLKSLPLKARKHLGSAYEQFTHSHWREGFEDACQALENLSRKYLLEEIKKGRVQSFVRKNGPVPATKNEVENMTLGKLAHAFRQIPNQNQTDAQLAKKLLKINKDRVGVVHHKNKSKTENRLRKNVGTHMWSIISGVKLLC